MVRKVAAEKYVLMGNKQRFLVQERLDKMPILSADASTVILTSTVS